ncbi:MerR family transcriptional regulator [Ponticoccus alexandrii]|uniref:MerR family transcriptional regulator n=1 Tax=Ponticoccus alexandrii TaxID=1943633 RepID=UPI0003D1BFD4|nr:MerR family transcriptional regulator [Ponticoccus alexandrii]
MSKSRDAFRTISEVADWLETPAHVLRFWESKFSQVKPVKRAGGRRYYRPADMELLGGIKKLLHEDGMTIKGVQKVLREQGVRHVCSLSAMVGAEDDDTPDAALIEDAPFEEVAEAPATSEILTFPTSATARSSARQSQHDTTAAGETGAPPPEEDADAAALGTDSAPLVADAQRADAARSDDPEPPAPATTEPAPVLGESAPQTDREETDITLEFDHLDQPAKSTAEAAEAADTEVEVEAAAKPAEITAHLPLGPLPSDNTEGDEATVALSAAQPAQTDEAGQPRPDWDEAPDEAVRDSTGPDTRTLPLSDAGTTPEADAEAAFDDGFALEADGAHDAGGPADAAPDGVINGDAAPAADTAAKTAPEATRDPDTDDQPPASEAIADHDATAELPGAAPTDAEPAANAAPVRSPASDTPAPLSGDEAQSPDRAAAEGNESHASPPSTDADRATVSTSSAEPEQPAPQAASTPEAGEHPLPSPVPQPEAASQPVAEAHNDASTSAATPVGRPVDLPDFTAQAEATQVPGPLTHLVRIDHLTKTQAQALAAPLTRLKALRDRLNQPLS